MARDTIKNMQLLKRHEVVDLIEKVPERSRFAIELGFHSCLTLDELATGYRANVSIDNQEIFIPARPGKPARYIRLAQAIVHRLRTYFDTLHGDHIFVHPKGTAFTIDLLRVDFSFARLAIGRSTLRYDDFRWTCASWLLHVGVRQIQVAARLGIRTDAVRARFPNTSGNEGSIGSQLDLITLQ